MNKHYAAQQTLHSSKGYTLLETLISLAIFLIIVSMFVSVMHYRYSFNPEVNSFAYEEYVLFLRHLQTEFRNSEAYWVDDRERKLYFVRKTDGYTVHYEQYEDKIRRQVRGRGHEVMMQRVTGFRVYDMPYGVDVEVYTRNGSWRKPFVHPSSSTGEAGTGRHTG